MEDNGLEQFMKVFLENAEKTGQLDFDLEGPEESTMALEVRKEFCIGDAYTIARTLVDTGFVGTMTEKQFITIVEIIYQLKIKHGSSQSI